VYREPAFLGLIDLVRGADVAFTNLEMLFHDYESWAMNEGGGTYMRADPALAGELAWAGFDLVSRANNHAGDYGVVGMRLTTEYVAKAGLVQAGVGSSLAEAREAKFLDTAKARVALVSVSSTFPDHARAGRTRGDVPARPGLNPLRYQTTYTLTRERMEAFRTMLQETGVTVPAQADKLTAFGNHFVVGDKPGIGTEPLKEDVDEIAAVVRSASKLADHTIVAVHSHENAGHRSVPAQFLVTFAHAMIDAGADVVAGGGPHVLRGIEIYKGRPIFYSLGNFLFENETLLRLPSENYETYNLGPTAHVADFGDARTDSDRRGWPAERDYWESILAIPEWKGGSLAELKIYPLSLGFGQSRATRGRPLLAEGATAQKILDDVTRLSKPFGTVVEIHDGTGSVDLKRSAGQ
jgi:poly-gamma-glutamate synthesis protein (capsule biosynthesis protein)